MATNISTDSKRERIIGILERFSDWLEGYGETSFDHQSFFAGRWGGGCKALYYRKKWIGLPAVAPMIFCEAFLPSARKLFHERIRLPIADAHYAMGYELLYQSTRKPRYLDRAVHFLNQLKGSRCPSFKDYCWGYPFDWVTRNGTIVRQTPLITTTPYAYEAFLLASEISPQSEWKAVVESIVRHVICDIRDFETSSRASCCSYTPFDKGGVINASAYRAFVLISASRVLCEDTCLKAGLRNLNFVLENQKPDGSWDYAVHGVRDFVDHFHTCFVMKALAKIHTLTNHEGCGRALTKGVEYYCDNLFNQQGLPKPFAVAPRLTVYKQELYDCAECINLCLLLREPFPVLGEVLERVINDVLENWVKADGSFRSRRLLWGWDNVPMHRWGQSQMFRSLALYLSSGKGG